MGGPDLLMIEDRSDPESCPDRLSACWQSFLRGSPLPDVSKAPSIRVVDLFCGAGGFALGVSLAARSFGRRAWFERIVDADPGALAVHARSLDVGRTINAGATALVDYQIRQRNDSWSFAYRPEIVAPGLAVAPGIDLAIAGPPCLGHSNLNNHTRRKDPRNVLFICTVAIAIALRSRAILIENVRTVTKSHGDVVRMARQLLDSESYDVTEEIVRSDRLLGWPQRRERFFMTAVRDDASLAPLLWSEETEEKETQSIMWAIGDIMELRNPVEPFDTAPTPTDETRNLIDWLFDPDSNSTTLWDTAFHHSLGQYENQEFSAQIRCAEIKVFELSNVQIISCIGQDNPRMRVRGSNSRRWL